MNTRASVEQKFCRLGRIIQHLERNEDGELVVQREERCKTTNEAKRKSREYQMSADGALGRGSLKVVPLPHSKKKSQQVFVHPTFMMTPEQRAANRKASEQRANLIARGVLKVASDKYDKTSVQVRVRPRHNRKGMK